MNKIYNIGQFEFDSHKGLIRTNDSNTKLEPLAIRFLCFLIKHQGEVVSREQLLVSVWQNREVSDDSIRKVIKKLRKAFNDDARQPNYIKTVSMQGYSLIAKVSQTLSDSEENNKNLLNNNRVSNKTQKLAWLIALGLVLLAVSIWLYFEGNDFNQNHSDLSANIKTNEYPQIEKLTLLSGSEIFGDFNDTNERLVFSHRNNNNEVWHLYTKAMSNGEVKRLTWDGGSYKQAIFSPDGRQLAYTRTDEKGIETWLSDFDQKLGLVNPVMLSKDYFVKDLLSWSGNGKSLYFYGREQQLGPFSIYQLNLESRQWQQVTFPTMQALGDFEAKESPDGTHLAVIRSTGDSRFSLMVMDLQSKDLVVDKTMSFNATDITWQLDSASLAVSSFEGDFYTYTLGNMKFLEKTGCNPGLNDVFYSCGVDCFYMRSHHMNYTDIKEIPNPFEPMTHQATLHMEAEKAELNPIYNHTGDSVYFSSIDEDMAHIYRRKVGSDREQLTSFGARRTVNDLSLNPAETFLLGKLQGRIFILDLATKQMKYITSALDNVNLPTWQDNETVLFARRQPVGSSIFSYNLLQDKQKLFKNGLLIQKQLSDGRIFIVDEQRMLYRLGTDNTRHLVTQLPNEDLGAWHVYGDYLYFTNVSGQDVNITRHHLTTKQQQTKVMTENTNRLDFNIHPNGKKFLITQSLLADSDLVKVHWSGTGE